MNKYELAIRYFKEGYNCTQSIVLSFADEIGIEKDKLAKIVSGLGGGISRLREVCGAFSGAVIVISSIFGYSMPNDLNSKNFLYGKVQEFSKIFEKEFAFLTCRELLKLDHLRDNPISKERNEEFYKTRPCVNIIGKTAELLNDFFEKNQ